MTAEVVDFSGLMSEYGLIVAEAALVTVIGVGAYYIRRDQNRLDKDLEEARDMIPRVISIEEQLPELKKDVAENQEDIRELRTQIVENQKGLTKHISTHAEKTADEFKEVRALLGEIKGYLEGKKED